MLTELTERRAAVLKCIQDFAKQGHNPRITEIGSVVGLGQTAVTYHVQVLENLGYLRPRPKRQHRAIALAKPLETAA